MKDAKINLILLQKQEKLLIFHAKEKKLTN
jgi:hypothetical protein